MPWTVSAQYTNAMNIITLTRIHMPNDSCISVVGLLSQVQCLGKDVPLTVETLSKWLKKLCMSPCLGKKVTLARSGTWSHSLCSHICVFLVLFSPWFCILCLFCLVFLSLLYFVLFLLFMHFDFLIFLFPEWMCEWFSTWMPGFAHV